MKTIFVHNATILDCAVLADHEGPRGQSWHVDVFWKGEVVDDGVLIDFAEAKKVAKHVIDTSFDHRLFVSESAVVGRGNGRMLVLSPWNSAGETGVFALDTYENGVVAVPDDVMNAVAKGELAPLEKLVAQTVQQASPDNIGEVVVRLRNPDTARANFFSYTHSLQCHAGNCQRFHGHGNVIEVLRDGVVDAELSAKAAEFLAGRYLVPRSYLSNAGAASEHFGHVVDELKARGLWGNKHAFVEYKGTQGTVCLVLPSSVILATPDESTIESIADFVKSSLFFGRDVQVVAYEGLQKGAFSS